MGNERVYNFSAGPSMLPLEVLERAGAEITNYQGSGMSVMEMSHRSKVFVKIFEDTKAKLRRLMNVPEEYEILFLQGGASTQFSMAPLNLIGKTGKADYAVTGNFSNIAYKEAQKYGQINLAASSADRNHTYIPAQEQLKLDPEASYFYYCANNTIYGTEWPYVPETNGVPIVCDMSSDILSRPVDVSKYGIIFAGAQKNMAPAGLTVVIIRKELAGNELPYTLHVQHPALLVHLHAGPGAGLAGVQGRHPGHGGHQARQGPDALRRDRQLPALHLRRGARLPLRHERGVPHRERRAGRQVRQGERGGRLHQPEGPPLCGRHAGVYLQRHAHRGCGKAVRLHQGLRQGELSPLSAHGTKVLPEAKP